MEEKKRQIPFVKPVQVGNYRLYRSTYTRKRGEVTEKWECINITSLDGAWSVRIPETLRMFGVLTQTYAIEDEKVRDGFLSLIFGNMYNITTTDSENLHEGLDFLTGIIATPFIMLSEGSMKSWLSKRYKAAGMPWSERRKKIKAMVSYRRDIFKLIHDKVSRMMTDYETALVQLDRLDEEKLMQETEAVETASEVLNSSDGEEQGEKTD